MSARDIFHNAVKIALQKDGWTITHDPLTVDLADEQLQIDLGAERLIAAQRDKEEIAVEVKIKVEQPARKLYLGVSLEIYESFFGRQLPQLSLDIAKDGKIWIQYDGTEEGIANKLVERGISKDDIVLAYQSTYTRQLSGFAVS